MLRAFTAACLLLAAPFRPSRWPRRRVLRLRLRGSAPAPVERVALPPVPLREAPSLLETSPAGWTSVQPGPSLAGWTRLPWPATATLVPRQWSVDPATGHLVCDGQGGHEWLRYDRDSGTRPSTSSGASPRSREPTSTTAASTRAPRPTSRSGTRPRSASPADSSSA